MKKIEKKYGMLLILIITIIAMSRIPAINVLSGSVNTDKYLLEKIEPCVYQTDVSFETDVNLIDIQFKEKVPDTLIKGIVIDEHGYYLYEQEIVYPEETIIAFGNRILADKVYQIRLSFENDMESDTFMADVNYREYVPVQDSYKIFLYAVVILVGVIATALVYSEIYKKNVGHMIQISQGKPKAFEYVLLGIVFMIPFLTFLYEDTKAFIHYEVNFWGSIFEGGGLKYFYEYSYSKLRFYIENGIGGQYAADYEFPLYIVLGTWGLPLYVVCQIFGLEETTNIGTMIYGKAIFVLALIVVACLIYKICRNIDIDEIQSKWAAFLFLSSGLVTVEVGIVGQIDILGIIFTLLGVYFYQRQKYWGFLIAFMIAVSFKQFPLFMFIPLLLLIEKNVIKLCCKTVFVWGFSLLSSYLFQQDTMGMSFKEEFAEQSLEVLLGVKIPLYNDTVPLVVVLLGAVCVYCYMKKIDDIQMLQKYAVYVPVISMFALLISFDSNPYWYIQLAPFMAILTIYNSTRIRELLLFETIGTVCLLLNQYGANYWIYDPEWVRGTLFDKIFHMPDEIFTMKQLSAYLRLDRFSGVFFATFVVCYVAFFVLSTPNKMKNEKDASIRLYALGRLFLQGMVAWIPVGGVILTCLLYR